jgi:1-acyl-sn-glycerol-3-phosphate acyltransferase
MCWLMVLPVFRLLLRGRTAGLANVPRQGGLVVVANHGSHLDPPILGSALRRPVAVSCSTLLACLFDAAGICNTERMHSL